MEIATARPATHSAAIKTIQTTTLMIKKVHLYVDSNLFFQFKPLTDVNWKEIGEFDEIDVIVCRPVQAEVDKHKNKGSGRTSGRARTTSALFKQVLDQQGAPLVLIDDNPKLRLVLRLLDKFDPQLNHELDPGNTDDQIVGLARQFKNSDQSLDIRVMSDDIGPRASSLATNMDFIPIPESWRLPQETNEQQKRITELTQRVELLERKGQKLNCA